MRKPKDQIIVCPVCGAEYLPAEIFIPESFVGKPSFIDKDHMTHKIEAYFGKNMDLKEEYECDHCKSPLKITARIQFDVKENEELNFHKEYSTKLKQPKLQLEED